MIDITTTEVSLQVRVVEPLHDGEGVVCVALGWYGVWRMAYGVYIIEEKEKLTHGYVNDEVCSTSSLRWMGG
jgi:hypothetical protein